MLVLLRIGLVGLGFIGKQHLEAYKQIDGVEVVAICTRLGKANPNIPSSFTGQIYPSFNDMLADDAIEVVDICTPTFLHEETILLAARHGKHIICEKPLTLSYESAKHIAGIIEQNNVRLFVSHVLRFWPAYHKVKQLIAEEGGMELVHAKRLGQSPNWATWFQDPQKSGGTLYDLHIHDIDYLIWLFGEVRSVYATGFQNHSDAWDYVCTTVSFANGVKAIVEASHRLPEGMPFTMQITAQSPATFIRYEFTSTANIDSRKQAAPIVYKMANQTETEIQVQDTDPFVNQLQYFSNCISEDAENEVVPLKDVLYTLHILEVIEKSLMTNEVIHLP